VDSGFEAAFATPVAFFVTIGISAAMVVLLMRTALIPETRFTSWARGVTGRNGRYGFGFLLILWVAGMGFLASLNLPANTAGGPALIGMFVGFFLFMGFIWAVIGE
jgi:hypothetical protein